MTSSRHSSRVTSFQVESEDHEAVVTVHTDGFVDTAACQPNLGDKSYMTVMIERNIDKVCASASDCV